MRRKLLLSILCISIVSTLLVPNSMIPSSVHAAGEKRIAIYNGEQITVTVEGDYVILPDEEQILLENFTGTFIEEKPVVSEVPEKPGEVPAEPEVSAGNNTESSTSGTNTDESDMSEQPGNMEQPTPPEQSGISEQPEIPEQPEISEQPEIPEQPEISEQPEIPEQPEISEQLEETKHLFPEIKPVVTAGIDFYIEELEEKYQIRFEDNFKETVSEIEEEFLENIENTQESVESEEAEENNSLKFTNWQDVLAVYLLNEKKSGVEKFIMNAEDKEELSCIFAQMNAGIMEDEEVVIVSRGIEEYESAYPELTDEDREFLKKYTSSNCALLCAATTGIKGFIIGSLGKEVSEERVQVVASAYSLLGKVSYFWGGKSSVIGWDSRWGNEAVVTAAGSRSFGTTRNYGLDCSGFVTWAFINGYEDTDVAAKIGEGTTSQWGKSVEISEEEALPGDLVFLRTPSELGINHVGIVVGKNDDGKLVVVHCNSGDNGIVVESAYSAGFRYIRRPAILQDEKS